MGNLKKQTFPVLNMHCAGCANNVEKTVRKLVGVADDSVNFDSKTLSVFFDGQTDTRRNSCCRTGCGL